MKSFLKLFVPALALGVLSGSLVRAEDQAAPPPPPPPGDTPPPPGGPVGGGGGRRGGRGGPMMDPAQLVQRLDAAVKLTDDQKAKVTDIYKKAQTDAQALRGGGGGGGGRGEGMAKLQEIMKTAHDDVRALLTADQQKKFDAMPPPPGPGGRGGRRGRGGPGGPDGAPPPAGGDATPPPAPAPAPAPAT